MPKKHAPGGKGKGKGKGGKKPKDPNAKKLKKIPEGLSPSEMTAGQLMAHIKRLVVEKDREVEERNLFMLEKNKLWALWQLAVDKVKILKDEASHMEVKLEQSRKDKEKEKEMYNQKLRMLQGEEIKKFGMVRLNHLNYMKKLSDDIWAIENILRESSLSKKKNIRKQLASFYEILRGLRLSHAKSVSDMFQALSRTIGFFESGQDRSFFDRKSSWEDSYLPRMELLRANKMEKLDLTNLAHEQTLLEMKTFFDDVTTNNLAVMTMLAEEIDVQKLYENRLKRDLRWSKEKYHSIHIPLQKMIADLQLWESDNRNALKLARALKANEILLKKKEHCRHMLEVTNECALQQIEIATVERDKLRVEFSKAARKMQRAAQMQSLICQLKTKTASKDRELFQSLSKNITKPHSDKTNYFTQLTCRRSMHLRKLKEIRKNRVFENYATNPKEVECIANQEVVDLGSIGLVNRKGCINQPWRKIQKDYAHVKQCVIPQYKEILDPKNIFNQLPQVVPKPIALESTTSVISLGIITGGASVSRTEKGLHLSRKSTDIVSIYPPKNLQNITSRAMPVLHHDHKEGTNQKNLLTKDKLTKLLYRVRFGHKQDTSTIPMCEYSYLQTPNMKPSKLRLAQCQDQSVCKRQVPCNYINNSHTTASSHGQNKSGYNSQSNMVRNATSQNAQPRKLVSIVDNFNKDRCGGVGKKGGLYEAKSMCLRKRDPRTKSFRL